MTCTRYTHVGRDVHIADLDPDAETCFRYRIVRHPMYSEHYQGQIQTIVDYKGDDAQEFYEWAKEMVDDGGDTLDIHPMDLDDDQQNAEMSV